MLARREHDRHLRTRLGVAARTAAAGIEAQHVAEHMWPEREQMGALVVGNREQVAEPPLPDLVHQPFDRDRDAHPIKRSEAFLLETEPGLGLEVRLDDRSVLGIGDIDRAGERQLGSRLVEPTEAGQRPRRGLVGVGVVEVGGEVACLLNVGTRLAGVVQRQLTLAEHGVAARDEP